MSIRDIASMIAEAMEFKGDMLVRYLTFVCV